MGGDAHPPGHHDWEGAAPLENWLVPTHGFAGTVSRTE